MGRSSGRSARIGSISRAIPFVLLACGTGSELRLDLRTDYLASEIDRLEVALAGGTEERLVRITPEGDLLTGVRVATWSVEPGPQTIRAILVARDGRSILQERSLVVLAGKGTTAATLVFNAACEDVTCDEPGRAECVAGVCVPAE